MNKSAIECRKQIIAALTQYELPRTEAAVRLLCMIAAHESGKFMYTKQARGPALSHFQMEPASFNDVKDYAIRRHLLTNEFPSNAERMIFDFPFAVAMSRIFLLRIREPLPDEDDLDGLSNYAKQYWNTRLGKATPQQYLKAYRELFVE